MEYKELKELLIKANNAYYKDSTPIMSDYEFDKKLKQLEKIEEKQGYADIDSPTQHPGSDLAKVDTTNKHGRPMLSLENTYTVDEVKDWYDKMAEATGKNPEVVCEWKYDGGSCAIRFINGQIVKALTRGDGIVGEDITQNVSLISDLKNIKDFTGEVRGELIMTKEGFAELNKNGEYQNARNLLSGTMKLLDPKEFKAREKAIRFYAYWNENSPYETHSENIKDLQKYGFRTSADSMTICKSYDELLAAINKIDEQKKTYDVEIDGAVMKLNDTSKWPDIGSTAKFPRWAKAFKYKQESAETTINKIEFWVGRTGKVTPVVWFDPVFIDGSTVQKATLNNKEFYDAMDVAVGDTVEIQKAAAIIPQIINVSNRPKDRQKVPFPVICPSCGCKLRKHKDEHNDYFCDNEDCPERVVDKIINFTRSMEIDGFAEIVVSRMHDAGVLETVQDVYSLYKYKNKLVNLERMGEKTVEKLFENIEASKKEPFWKVLSGLGIPGVGPKTAKTLAKKFKTMVVLESATVVELQDTDDIGEITAEQIVKWFKEPSNKRTINELTNAGVCMSTDMKDDEKPEINLNGKSFCITGALSLKRDTYIELLEGLGAKVVGSVSKNTSYLITNDKTTGTTKNIKAKQLGIPVLNERELLEMCDALNLLKELN